MQFAYNDDKAPIPRWEHLDVWSKYTEAWDNKSESDHPRFLWRTCWQKYNTIQIPIIPATEYFETAINIARIAKNEEDFKRIFEERHKQRQKKIKDVLQKISSWGFMSKQVPEDMVKKATKAARFECYTHFLRVLKEIAFNPDSATTQFYQPADECSIEFTDKLTVDVPLPVGFDETGRFICRPDGSYGIFYDGAMGSEDEESIQRWINGPWYEPSIKSRAGNIKSEKKR